LQSFRRSPNLRRAAARAGSSPSSPALTPALGAAYLNRGDAGDDERGEGEEEEAGAQELKKVAP